MRPNLKKSDTELHESLVLLKYQEPPLDGVARLIVWAGILGSLGFWALLGCWAFGC